MAVTTAVYFFPEKKWFWYFFYLVLALYSDYLPWLMIPVFLFWSRKNSKLLIAHLSLLILFLPWLPFFWQQLRIGTSAASNAPLWGQVVGGLEIKSVPLLFVKFIIGRISLADKTFYTIVMLPILAVYGYTLARARNLKLGIWLVTPILIGVLVSFKIPLFSYFRFLFVLPAFVLLLAQGSQKNKWLCANVLLVSVISLAIFNLNPSLQREDWRSTIAFIHSHPGLVLLPSLAQVSPVQYYAPNQLVQDKNSVNLGNNKNVYRLRYVQEIFDPSDSLRSTLEKNHYRQVEQRNFNGVIVWRYEL